MSVSPEARPRRGRAVRDEARYALSLVLLALTDWCSVAACMLLVWEVRERLLALATIPIGESPEHFDQYLRADIDKWARVIRAGNIKAE